MFKYIIKRLLIFVPTFFIISLIIFGLSKMAPGDPVEVLLTGGTQAGRSGQRSDLLAGQEAYNLMSRQLGLDKPVFYFTLNAAAYPDSLYRINQRHHRELISRLISQSGNAEATMNYYRQLKDFELMVADLPTDSSFYEPRRLIKQTINDLFLDYVDAGIVYKLDTIQFALNEIAPQLDITEVLQASTALKNSYEAIAKNPKKYLLYLPRISWYGSRNQYHTWMFGDYPWFQSVDSTNNKLVNTLYQDLAKLNNKEDSLDRIFRAIDSQTDRIEKMIAQDDSLRVKQLKALQRDSLNLLLAEMNAEKKELAVQIEPLAAAIKEKTVLKDSLIQTVQVYASRGFIRGDFGVSYKDNRPVSTKMGEALFWTLIMNFFAILISYLVSVPLGVQSAIWKKAPERMFPLLSLPNLIAAGILACSFYLYMSNLIAYPIHYVVVALVNIVIFIYIVINKNDDTKKPFKKEDVLEFWINLLQLKVLKVADNSLIVLRLLYLWIWVLVFFIFALIPLVGKIILISIPLLFWLIRKVRGKVKPVGERNLEFSKSGLSARGTYLDNLTTTTLFILYSLPNFWVGALLIVFFTTNQYGELFDWFPTSGVQTLEIANNPHSTEIQRYSDILYHLFLPTFCITFGSFAYLSRQMRGAMLGVAQQDYIRTANAKGLSQNRVIWKHAFRNSLFPIITLFGSVFPRALSGAIAIELIYNVPGMGSLVLGAINERDWPVVFTVAMFAAILTMIGNLIADILYALVDPRVSFK